MLTVYVLLRHGDVQHVLLTFQLHLQKQLWKAFSQHLEHSEIYNSLLSMEGCQRVTAEEGI